MPIHFTCPHCGQLLSTARRKIGKVVNCINCHGNVIVPAPLNHPITRPETAATDSPDDSLDDSLSAQPEPALFEDDRPGRPTPYSDASAAAWHWNREIAVSRAALYSIGAMIVGVALVSFFLGWAMGRESSVYSGAIAANAKQTIYGRLTYVTDSRSVSGDSEAVAIALPVGVKPDEKIEISSLRPDVTTPLSQDISVQRIRSLGGDFVRTGRNGDYELHVPKSGEYYVLFLSGHSARSQNRPPTTTEILNLGSYFNKADELLGENAFWWSKQIVRTNKKIDFLFDGK